MKTIYTLTDIDKEWVRSLFISCQDFVESDFEKAWEEGTFYGVPQQGFIRIHYSTEGKDNIICELVVHPACRNKGIAKRLLNYALSPCLVATHKHNIPANRLYCKCGFLHIGEVLDRKGNILNLYRR